jgi:hypothetical protein
MVRPLSCTTSTVLDMHLDVDWMRATGMRADISPTPRSSRGVAAVGPPLDCHTQTFARTEDAVALAGSTDHPRLMTASLPQYQRVASSSSPYVIISGKKRLCPRT